MSDSDFDTSRGISKQSKSTMSDEEDSEDSEDFEAELKVLEKGVGDEDIVFEVTYKEEVIEVTHRAKKCLEGAMEATANQPTHFQKCRYVVLAICDILGDNLLNYSFPTGAASIPKDDSDDDSDDGEENALGPVNWNEVIPGRTNTYPKPRKPSKRDNEKVNSVYSYIKALKDEEARKHGFLKSGIQSYKTFKAKALAWRKWCAVYDELGNAENMTSKTKLDKMMADLKLCRSEPVIDEKIKRELQRHLNSLKRAAKREAEKAEAEQALQAVQEKEDSAKANVEKLKAKEAKLRQNKLSIMASTSTRNGNKTALFNIHQEEKKTSTAFKAAMKLSRTVAKEKVAVSKKKAAIDKASTELPPTKKAKHSSRCDITLVNEETTPRKLVDLDGEEWNPPRRAANGYNAPGEMWKEASCDKVDLLIAVYSHLVNAGVLDKSPPFCVVMDFLSIDEWDDPFDFFSKAFVHLVGLMLYPHFEWDFVVTILLRFLENDILRVGSMASASREDVTASIVGEDGNFECGQIVTNLINVAKSMDKLNSFPTTLDGLTEAGVDIDVGRKLCRDVFGATDLVIGLDTRKVVVALDLIDWEEVGPIKSDLKMRSLSAAKVKNSLMAWLPPGKRLLFQEAIETLGAIIGSNKMGFWGRFEKQVKKQFSTKESDQALQLANKIVRFYKVTKMGARKKLSL